MLFPIVFIVGVAASALINNYLHIQRMEEAAKQSEENQKEFQKLVDSGVIKINKASDDPNGFYDDDDDDADAATLVQPTSSNNSGMRDLAEEMAGGEEYFSPKQQESEMGDKKKDKLPSEGDANKANVPPTKKEEEPVKPRPWWPETGYVSVLFVAAAAAAAYMLAGPSRRKSRSRRKR